MEKTERLLSLDVFRGITVAAMILVNNPGSWSTIYSPLAHAKWDGCTPTDLIFPFFLFIVGVSIHLAMSKQKEKGVSDNTLIFKAFKRGLIIFALGLFLAGFPYFNLYTIRIPGVLQRIALVFFACVLIYVKTSRQTQIYLTAFFLVLYWILMTWIPVPGVGTASLQPEANLGAWLDRLFLNGHLWSQSKTWDPEGILGTIPAIGTGLLGVLTGGFLSSRFHQPAEKVAWLFVYGSFLAIMGLWWGLVFPINKSLWTSSYVLYAGGLAMMGLALCYWLIDVQKRTWWIAPFQAFGVNAITAFFMSGLLIKISILLKVASEGEKQISFNTFLFKSLYAGWLDPYNASLAMAVTWVLFFFIPIRWMYRRNVIIKV
jgi:predicted acyltransferase